MSTLFSMKWINLLMAFWKISLSKCFFYKQTFRRSDFTYGVTKDQNVESLLCQKTFRCSDFTYGVEKDHYVESLFFMLFSTFWSSELWSTQKPFSTFWSFWLSTFWSTKKTISTFWNFWPVVVLKFDLPTPSHSIWVPLMWFSIIISEEFFSANDIKGADKKLI
jgi:hypothetical protein